MFNITIIIPTFNEERNIRGCINSILNQNYPKDLLQIIVIDGNSTDKTIEIAKEMNAEIIKTDLPNEELKRPFAFNQARGEIIGGIDADNRIPDDKDWLVKMVEPFKDEDVSATDTLYYTYRDEDNLITKYCALVGGDDPVASYFGINDRYCYFTGRWTGMPHQEFDKGNYIKVILNKTKVPASGSNGFFFRKKILDTVPHDPFIHQKFICDMAAKGFTTIAKVKTGLIHEQNGSMATFFKKKIRRLNRRYSGDSRWQYNYGMDNKDICKKILYISTLVLPFKDMLCGLRRRPTFAWFFHPVALSTLLFIYAYYVIKGGGNKKSFYN